MCEEFSVKTKVAITNTIQLRYQHSMNDKKESKNYYYMTTQKITTVESHQLALVCHNLQKMFARISNRSKLQVMHCVLSL